LEEILLKISHTGLVFGRNTHAEDQGYLERISRVLDILLRLSGIN